MAKTFDFRSVARNVPLGITWEHVPISIETLQLTNFSTTEKAIIRPNYCICPLKANIITVPVSYPSNCWLGRPVSPTFQRGIPTLGYLYGDPGVTHEVTLTLTLAAEPLTFGRHGVDGGRNADFELVGDGDGRVRVGPLHLARVVA